MKFRTYALVAGALTVIGLAACSQDPTGSGSGEPEAIVTNRSEINQTKNASFSVTAYAIDKNDQRMAGKLEAVSNGAAIVVDSVPYVPELLETRVFMKAVGSTASGTTVTISGHGLTKDVKVIVP